MTPILSNAGNTAMLCRIPTDRFKTGLLSFLAAIPIDRESACLAPLLLSVLRRGTAHYPTLADISRRLDWLWGTGFSVRSSYRGNLLMVGFTANLLDASYLPGGGDDLLSGVPELRSEILLAPVRDADGLLSARYTESEKGLQIDAIRAQKNNPRSYACDRARGILYAEEPCGIPLWGTEEQTAAVTHGELTAYYERFLRDFHPMVFSVGTASEARLTQEITARFGGRLTAPGTLPHCGHRLKKRTEPVRVTETLPVSQSQLVLGLRSGILLGEPDFFACAVYNELLGMSPVSRLFVYVREKKSLCYSCSSGYQGPFGSLLISCGLKKENREAAEEEILHQLELIRTGDFSEEELDAAKKSLTNAYRQLEDSAGGTENYWLGRMLMGNGTALPPSESILRIAAVSREDILRVASAVTVEVTYFLEGTLAGEEGTDDDEGI